MDNLRRFLVVFTAMFFIAAAVCGFMLVQSYNDAEGQQVEDLLVSAPTYDPNGDTSGSIFRENILCMVADSGKKMPELTFIINVDSLSGHVSFLFIPQNMKYAISQTGEMGTFGEYCGRYAWNTAGRAASLLSSFLDIHIEHYLTLSTKDFGLLISAFSSEDEGVYLEIPVDIEYKNEKENLDISFTAGPQYLKGAQAAQFIQFYQTQDGVYTSEMLPYYDGTDVKRIGQVQRFLDAFMCQKFTQAATNVYKEHFSELLYPYLAKGNTNLTGAILDRIATVVEQLQTDRVNYFMLNGKVVYNQNEYLEYNNTMRNFLLEESVSTVKADDILASRFGTGG